MENRDEDERPLPPPAAEAVTPIVEVPKPVPESVALPPASEVPFENVTLDVAALPGLDTQTFVSLDPGYRSYRYVMTTLLFGGLFAAYLVVLLLSAGWPSLPWLLATFALFGVAYGAAMWLVRAGYRVAGYALRTHDISFRRGVIIRRLTVVPFSRVQHSEVQEGAVERSFGLATLLVYTAGGNSSDLSISGLLPAEAHRLKDYVSTQIAAVHES